MRGSSNKSEGYLERVPTIALDLTERDGTLDNDEMYLCDLKE